MSEQQVAEKRKRSLSLIQPTSIPTLGNYLGAMRGWPAFQQEFDTIYGVADLHSITVRQEPQKLRKQTNELFAMLLADRFHSVTGSDACTACMDPELLHSVRRACKDDSIQR